MFHTMRRLDDPHLSGGADGEGACVRVTGVGTLIGWLHIVEDQSAIRGHLNMSSIGPHRNTIPEKERVR